MIFKKVVIYPTDMSCNVACLFEEKIKTNCVGVWFESKQINTSFEKSWSLAGIWALEPIYIEKVK